MSADERVATARKHAKAKFDFYVHVIVYLVVVGALFIINLLTSQAYLWYRWPATIWGIALLLHGVSTFLISRNKDDIIDTLARRELDNQPRKHR